MPEKKITNAKATIGPVQLPKNTGSGISIEVKQGNEKLGLLEIGQGSLRWTSKNKQDSRIIFWPEFAQWASNKK